MADERDRVPLFSAPALGDGLLTLALANNLHLQGRDAVLFHTQLTQLAAWFPWARIEPLPEADERRRLLAEARHAFVGDPTLAVKQRAGHLVFTKDLWDRKQPYLRSVATHAARVMEVDWRTDENGLVVPPHAPQERTERRVVLHPFSATRSKDWPVDRWLALAEVLTARGWAPRVLLAPGEEARWADASQGDARSAVPGPLDEVAGWLRVSGGVIAGDTGMGHLASSLGVPTLSIFGKRSRARFWRPHGGRTATVTPRVRLPGRAGDRHWARLLGAARVAKAFGALAGPPGA